jgi:DNA-binding NtrC family response regulator
MGYGSVFKIYLPIPDDAKAEGHKEIRKAPKPEVNGSETILLVEDEVIVQEMVVSMLKLQGYKVLTAEKGEGAIELLTSHENQVHLLLTDVVMPDMNGLELYDKLSKICPELKVIYMSGYTRDVIAYHGMLDAGVNFLQKPFSVNDLALKIREVLAG